MCLVEVDEHLFWQGIPAVVCLPEAAEYVFKRASDEEILLPEAQLLAGGCVVVGVKNLCQVLGKDLGLYGIDV